MYNQPYFIPRYITNASPVLMRGAMNGTMGRAFGGAMGSAASGARLATQGASKGLGLFGRLSSSMQAIKKINWGGLINNTSKTLNVVNQAIPLVRQVGPMVNNMKSMLRVASIFKDETDNNPKQKSNKPITNSNSYAYRNNITSNLLESSASTDIKANDNLNSYDNSPTFFINS